MMKLLKKGMNIVLLVIILGQTTCIGFSGDRSNTMMMKSMIEEEQTGKITIERICEEWKTDNMDESHVAKEYSINADVERSEYKIHLVGVPNIGIKVTDGNSMERSEFIQGENFKVLIPIEAIGKQKEDIVFKIYAITKLKTGENKWEEKECVLDEIYMIDDAQKEQKDGGDKTEDKEEFTDNSKENKEEKQEGEETIEKEKIEKIEMKKEEDVKEENQIDKGKKGWIKNKTEKEKYQKENKLVEQRHEKLLPRTGF